MYLDQIFFLMKKAIATFCLFIACHAAFSQGQFIIGVKGGMDGAFYTFNSSPTNLPINSTYGMGYTRIVSSGPSIPALLELIYGTKKFRVGYQFEYERILTTSYKVKVYDASGSYGDTTVYDPTITQHFFCHNLLIEYIVYDNGKNLRLVPDIVFGYFHGVSGATMAPYDFTALNMNRFKFGAALNLEYYLGPYNFVATPNFTLAPVKSIIDPNEKGYMFFVGINVGMRFNVTKSKQEADNNPKKPKKKQKEYVNPEEE
jgi:hypothetical protein